MNLKDSPSLDHIDPLWEEGRDYQLVCGTRYKCGCIDFLSETSQHRHVT
jgi:hypothetical protein